MVKASQNRLSKRNPRQREEILRRAKAARRLMLGEAEWDVQHPNLSQSGKDVYVGGTWVLEMSGRVECGEYNEIFWKIAKPEKDHPVPTMWGTFNEESEGVLKISRQVGGQSEPSLSMQAIRHEPFFEDLDCSCNFLSSGTIQFPSTNTCKGAWWCEEGTFEFTGRKVTIDCSVTVNQCEEAFKEATNEWRIKRENQLRMHLGLYNGERQEIPSVQRYIRALSCEKLKFFLVPDA